MGLIEGKERIHGIAIGRDRAILDHRPVRTFRGYDILRCSLKSWGARADGPEMVEERSPECRMEEIVGESEFAGILPKLHLLAVVIPHHKAARIGDECKFIHLAAIDLGLLLIPEVREIWVWVFLPDIAVDRKWPVWKFLREVSRAAVEFC